MNEKKKLQPKVRFREFTGENAPDWEQRKLGEILSDLYNGQTPSRSVNKYWKGNIPWLTSGELNHGIVENTIEKISESGKRAANLRMIPSGTIVIAITGLEAPRTRGNCAILGIDTTVNQSVMALFVKDNIDIQFIFQWYKKIGQEYGIKYTQGTKQQSYNYDLVKILPINIPTATEEQERIGQFFEKLDKLITLHQRKLEQLEQLKNTLLSKMFPKSGTNIPEIRFSGFTDTWKQRKLGEVVNRFDNLRIPITESSRISGSTPYYGANGIQDYVEGYTHDGEYILIAEDGANDINNYPVFRVHGKIWVNNHAHVLQTIGDIADNDYVAYALKSINIGPYLVGGSRPKLNADSLMKLEIKLPKLSEQIKIGKIFLRIDYQIENYSQKLKNLKTAKKSLLDKLFI